MSSRRVVVAHSPTCRPHSVEYGRVCLPTPEVSTEAARACSRLDSLVHHPPGCPGHLIHVTERMSAALHEVDSIDNVHEGKQTTF